MSSVFMVNELICRVVSIIKMGVLVDNVGGFAVLLFVNVS